MRYLVESGTLPVDSGPFTPLMAVMTRRCTLSAHSATGIKNMSIEGGRGLTTMSYAHVCGRRPSACIGKDISCRPLLPMAQLLIQLGADATAVHSSRGCLLTIAASAGEWGLWELLVRDAPDLASSLAARCHAGRVLLGAMYSYLRDGEHSILGSVINFLQSSFSARGQQQLFLQQVNAPLEVPADIFGHAINVHTLFGGRVHALCLPLLQAAGCPCRNAVQQLLQAGVTPGALKLGRQQYQLGVWSNAEAVLAMVEHAVAGADAGQCGDILVGLLCQCCVVDTQERPLDAALVARMAGLLAEAGIDFRQERWWPRQFTQSFADTWPKLCQAGVPVSPLVFACGVGSIRGAKGMVAALQRMDPQGWAQWVSEPAGPRGDVAPFIAFTHGDYQILRSLLDAKATLTPEQHALLVKSLSRSSSVHGPETQVKPEGCTTFLSRGTITYFWRIEWVHDSAQAAVEESRAYVDKHVQQCAHCRWGCACMLRQGFLTHMSCRFLK